MMSSGGDSEFEEKDKEINCGTLIFKGQAN